ncbi:MAG: 2OG-Fe(II) oxygenase [Proteobacteria bacterium]|nr:2OG-Fe(II) oxygenase [Pseudomonadota bacterium]
MDVDKIARGLRDEGFVAVEDVLPSALRARLDEGCCEVDGAFSSSGMGRGAGHNTDAAIRGDVTRWLEDTNEVDQLYLETMDVLRSGLNEQLFLGLVDYECHYAIYGVGARYGKHLDALAGRTNRLLSSVVYLNPAWALADGGELVMYRGDDPEPIARILPQPGLMVLFLSDEFPHEVLASTRSRHSIAGWFSGRVSSAGVGR